MVRFDKSQQRWVEVDDQSEIASKHLITGRASSEEGLFTILLVAPPASSSRVGIHN